MNENLYKKPQKKNVNYIHIQEGMPNNTQDGTLSKKDKRKDPQYKEKKAQDTRQRRQKKQQQENDEISRLQSTEQQSPIIRQKQEQGEVERETLPMAEQFNTGLEGTTETINPLLSGVEEPLRLEPEEPVEEPIAPAIYPAPSKVSSSPPKQEEETKEIPYIPPLSFRPINISKLPDTHGKRMRMMEEYENTLEKLNRYRSERKNFYSQLKGINKKINDNGDQLHQTEHLNLLLWAKALNLYMRLLNHLFSEPPQLPSFPKTRQQVEEIGNEIGNILQRRTQKAIRGGLFSWFKTKKKKSFNELLNEMTSETQRKGCFSKEQIEMANKCKSRFYHWSYPTTCRLYKEAEDNARKTGITDECRVFHEIKLDILTWLENLKIFVQSYFSNNTHSAVMIVNNFLAIISKRNQPLEHINRNLKEIISTIDALTRQTQITEMETGRGTRRRNRVMIRRPARTTRTRRRKKSRSRSKSSKKNT